MIFAIQKAEVHLPDGTNQPAPPMVRVLEEVGLVSPATAAPLSYQLFRTSSDPRATPEAGPFRLAPAALLYVAWCQESPSDCRHHGQWAKENRWPTELNIKLKPLWGIGERDGIEQVLAPVRSGPQPCITGTALRENRFIAIVRQLLHRVWPAQDPYCLYPPTLRAAELNNSRITPQIVHAALDGRLLLLGGNYRNSQDWIETDVSGMVPGVALHAMATDNLIELAGSGQLAQSDTPWFQHGINAMFVFFTLMVLAVCKWLMSHRAECGYPCANDVRWALRLVLAAGLLLLIMLAGTLFALVGLGSASAVASHSLVFPTMFAGIGLFNLLGNAIRIATGDGCKLFKWLLTKLPASNHQGEKSP